MDRYLVTGGAGFIGSNIVKELVSRGDFVKVIDNFSTGRKENIESFVKKIDLIEGDLRKIEDVRAAVSGVDFVLHQAAIPSVPRSVDDPVSTNSSNVDGTLNLLVAAKNAGVRRVVVVSSSSVYGNTEKLPKVETMAPNPASPYAVSKYAEELYGKVFYEIYGLETVSLRYFNVFGPNQNPNSHYAAVVPKFITKMLKGESPIVYGDGEQTRDFTYVDNVVAANLLAAHSENVGRGEVINIACGEKISINQLVGEINKILGTDIKPIYDKPRIGDVKHSFASIEKAKKLLGYRVKVRFEEGLRKLIEIYEKKKSQNT